jgi:hypothetical protein
VTGQEIFPYLRDGHWVRCNDWVKHMFVLFHDGYVRVRMRDPFVEPDGAVITSSWIEHDATWLLRDLLVSKKEWELDNTEE